MQLSSMARDMCAKVRIEAFEALAKMQRVSDGVLLQSLSKKMIKTDTGSATGKKVSPKLVFPCAAGIFAHGIEDEFYQVTSFLLYQLIPLNSSICFFCFIVLIFSLQVRAAACKALGELAKFSNQYAQKALDLLMDMMNDDTEAVRLQTLQTLLDMATYGHLSVQEKHMHMVLNY
jgi:integrator complex subunit 4